MLSEGPGPSRPVIDLNCDMGEGMDTDAAIFPFISSANIACGGHAGDRDTMCRTVELAMRYGVAIGAHPSYPDRAGFGRVDLLDTGPIDPQDTGQRDLLRGRPMAEALPDLLSEQLWQLAVVCREFGIRLHHVKPHGALYNRAARDASVAALIAQTVADFDPSLLLYGLSGSLMWPAATAAGLHFVSEIFADRTYRPDGSLTPRSEPGALIEDSGRAVAQVLRMVRESRVETAGGPVPITAQTVCLHGDGSHAVEFAELIHGALADTGISIAAPESEK